MIRFGTGGWRAIIGEEFTKANIQILAKAMADNEDPVLPVPAVVTVDIIASTAGQDLFFHGQVLPFLVGSIVAQGGRTVKKNVLKVHRFGDIITVNLPHSWYD